MRTRFSFGFRGSIWFHSRISPEFGAVSDVRFTIAPSFDSPIKGAVATLAMLDYPYPCNFVTPMPGEHAHTRTPAHQGEPPSRGSSCHNIAARGPVFISKQRARRHGGKLSLSLSAAP